MTIITPNVPQPQARFPLLFTCTTLLFLLHPGRCQAPGKQDSPLCPSPIKNFTVGFLLPISGFHSIGERVVKKVSQQVFRDANEKCRVAGYYLDYQVADTGCNTGRGLAQLLRFHREDIAHIFVGPVCESVCEMVNPVLTSRRASWVSFGCRMSNALDSTLVRTSATFPDLAHFVIAVVNHFEWFNGYLALLTEATSSDDWLTLRQAFQANMNSEGIYAAISVDNSEHFAREMTDLVEKSFVFVLCMYPETAWDFLKLAKTFNYYRKGLVFIVFDFANFGRRMNKTMDLTGLLDITVDVPYNSSSFDQFLDQVLDRNNNSSDDCDLDYELGIGPAQIADAVSLLIEGLNRSIQNPEYDTHAISQNVSRDLQNLTFQGVTGEIHMDSNRISVPRFLLNNLVNGCYYPVGRSQYTAQAAPQVDYEVINSTIIWPGPTKVKPSCPKGLCDSAQDLNLVLFLYLLVVVLTVAVIIGLVIKRREMIRDMGRGDWIITSEDLYSVTGRKTSTAKTKRKTSLGGLDETQTMDLSQESLKTFAMGQIFTKVTVMDQQLVAIKQVNKDNIVLTNEVFVEVNQIRNLRHTNVNQLIGACVEPGNLSLVWGYASKGSLRDVLSNDTFWLDWMFKISFITDIARGMAYIHSSPVNVHGRLKSSNVIVDINWSCKITDISMPIFRQGEEDNVTDDWLRAYNLLWVAPELLRLSEYPVRATKKGDVYAFAIIMFEILTRSQPFGLRSTDNPEEIILRVLNEEKPPFRPHMPEGEPEISLSKLSDYWEVLDLMMMCWDEYPLFRLPFTTVSQNLKKIRQSAGTARNLADEMLAEMTKYTDLLETQVEERTMQIQDEQEKADELLARMLPKSVTHDLKMGKTVIPESYHSVTIFFSDIVGFTALAARSTPLQVVNLLNDLYTLFDKVVDDYDAYKIETIGDAYMVVSGLPVRNGDQHAAEIASVALRILSCVLGFKIRHCPDHHLLLRIGLHTGPVLAGVVGLKMPRYCLFGDTVNYAARMESSGKPLHIHISETCKSYLDRLGDFHAKERGMMDIMGTGKTKTYFLLGKVGLHVIAETLPQEIRDKVGINVTFVDDKKMIKQQ